MVGGTGVGAGGVVVERGRAVGAWVVGEGGGREVGSGVGVVCVDGFAGAYPVLDGGQYICCVHRQVGRI